MAPTDDPMHSGSELTELDDEEEVPLSSRSKTTKPKAAGESGYRIRGALKVPRATTYTCQSLYEQISAGDIDLQPDYQRDVVWPDNKQVGLIDSIFRNFYVPPVIFVVHTTDDGGERRVCVDGKQRLTSIHRFISGEIPYRDPFTGEKFVFRNDLGEAKGQLLPERYRKLFLNKQIVCMEYQDITPENEREIFQRVQLGMALTPAERLQAINSPLSKFIRELLDTYIRDRLETDIEWDTSRASDFRGLAAALYSMSRGSRLTALPSVSSLEKWLQDSEALDKEFKDDVHNTFQIFCQLAKDEKLRKCFWLPGVKKVAPVEFLSVCLLIHTFKRKMTLPQLSESITLLRKDIRSVEKDIRQNTRTMKQILAFLKTLDTSQLKAKDGEPALVQHRPAKRKRSTEDQSEDESPPSRPVPVKVKSPTPSSSSQPPPPNPPTLPVPRPPAPTTQSATSSPSLRPSSSSGPPQAPNGTPSARSFPPPPTAPAALRQPPFSPSLPSRPDVPMPPPRRPPTGPASWQNSIGENLMARMASGPSPASMSAPRGGGYHSPPTSFSPAGPGSNDYHSNRAYDRSRDPRNPAYQPDARGYGGQGQPTGSSQTRKY